MVELMEVPRILAGDGKSGRQSSLEAQLETGGCAEQEREGAANHKV